MYKDKSILKIVEQINNLQGKPMPEAIDAEKKIIGSLMSDNSLITIPMALVKPEAFYSDANKAIYETILALFEKKMPFDLTSVILELKGSGKLHSVGGMSAVAKLTTDTVFEQRNIEHYCHVIEDRYTRRKIIETAAMLVNRGYDNSEDIADIITTTQEGLNKLALVPFDTIKKSPEMVTELYNRIRHNYNFNGAITGTPYGIRKLDSFTSGMQTTDFTIIAGEPSMGKTSFAVTTLNNASREGHPIGLISLEMASVQIMARIMAQETGISSKSILNYKLTDHEVALVDTQADQIKKRPIFIDPDCNSELSSIVTSIRMLHEKFNVKLFFIDYIQLITISTSKSNREGQLADIARTLKNLAKELDICIVALSQLNRDTNKKELPTMNRLRGSGQLEEAADNIIFVHRPEYHEQDFMPDGFTPSAGKAMLIIAKGRNIGTTEMTVSFDKTTGLFSEGERDFNWQIDNGYSPDGHHESTKEIDAF